MSSCKKDGPLRCFLSAFTTDREGAVLGCGIPSHPCRRTEQISCRSCRSRSPRKLSGTFTEDNSNPQPVARSYWKLSEVRVVLFDFESLEEVSCGRSLRLT